jgi:hypothetical protein
MSLSQHIGITSTHLDSVAVEITVETGLSRILPTTNGPVSYVFLAGFFSGMGIAFLIMTSVIWTVYAFT